MDVLFAVWTSYPSANIYADPSVYYRCYHPAAALRRRGIRAYVCFHDQIDLDLLGSFDIIIFFRPQLSTTFLTLLEKANASNAVCIASYDDLFFDITSLRQSGFRDLPTRQSTILGSRPYNYAQALYLFDKFIVSTTPLADAILGIAPASRIHIQYNAISPDTLEVARGATLFRAVKRVKRRIGYFAGGQSHASDLATIADAIVEAIQTAKAEFFCTTSVDLPPQLERTPGVVRLQRQTFMGLILAQASCCVTIAPLEINRFTIAKSGIKYLEASSVGACTVATPIPDIERVADDRLFPAVSLDEWRQQIIAALNTSSSASITRRQQTRLQEEFSTDLEAIKLAAFFENLLSH